MHNTMRKIGIIGSGVVAKALAKGFLSCGDTVMMGSRDPKKLDAWLKENPERAKTGTFDEAARFGDILVLAVSGKVVLNALSLVEEKAIENKTIIDATNPISGDPPEDGVLRFFTGPNESLLERIQEKYPRGNFVKAFNSVGNAFMVNPPFKPQATMFICGNNEGAKKEVTKICIDFGWELMDMGTAKSARAIEPLCMLWCIPGIREGKWNHAFKFLKM
jgi:8-hydroxy-5-deazaflavin:NADPH oxidoreductase